MTNDVHPMIPVPEAIRIVIQETGRVLLKDIGDGIKRTKTISSDAPWSDILGSVLSRDVIMKEPGYPGFNASIMDGYCIRSAEFDVANVIDEGFTHQIIDKVFAGDTAAIKKESGSESKLPVAYYITTGAVVPESFDCVVPIEDCQVSPDNKYVRIQSNAEIKKNKWIRPVGCDIPAGSVVLPRGHTVDPVALGLLKQSGVNSVEVKKPVIVGVMSTGNELIFGSKMEQSQHGKIPDVNRPVLLSLLSSFGVAEIVDLGTASDDDMIAMANVIDTGLEKCDVIITTGGISMGEADVVEKVLIDHCGGSLHFGRMHMKPGKPTTFVTIPKGDKTRLVFAMPGNPVSGFVCTQLLVKPCVDLLFHGVDETLATATDDLSAKLKFVVENAVVHPEIIGKLSHDIKLDHVRPEYHRVTMSLLPDGTAEVTSTGVQRSSRLMSLRDSMGLLVLPVGGKSKPIALQGESYPVLVTGDMSGCAKRVQLKNSVHLGRKKQPLRVSVVEIAQSDMTAKVELISGQVIRALTGSSSGGAKIVSEKSFSGDLEDLYSFCIDSNDADVIVVSCASYPGSFRHYLDVSSMFRNKLQKVATALSLQARQGAASQNSTAAIFESVVGYAPEEKGAMLICLPDSGLMGGLSNVRGLLKHALNVARGRPHNHHHKK
eukprot:scaffold23496_cov188-Cylindrotheca_fusiformis.AAC.10